MKTKSYQILTVLLCFLLVGSLEGQKDEYKTNLVDKFVFGTEIGVAAGTPIGPAEKGQTATVGYAPNDVIVTTKDPSGRPGLGLHAGIFTRYLINEKMALQLGLAYNAKKASYEAPVHDKEYTHYEDINLPDGSVTTAVIESFFNGTVEGKFNNQYLEAPLVFIYNLGDKWSVHGGPYASYLLKGKHHVWATGIVGDNFTAVEDQFSDESSSINTWDYGLNAGVNYKIFRQIECELRISSGLRSIFSDEYLLAEDTIRNLYLNLKANYTFQL